MGVGMSFGIELGPRQRGLGVGGGRLPGWEERDGWLEVRKSQKGSL